MRRLCRRRGGGKAPSRSTGWRCCATASTTSSTTTKAIFAFWSSSDADIELPIELAIEAREDAVKVLWSWLLELCDLDHQPTAEDGARALTRGGLEIEGMTDLG